MRLSGGDFDREATRYDCARPVYPEALFDRLMAQCRLSSGMRALEIGPGTGQATLALARRGLQIYAVELGPGLARIARSKLAQFSAVDVVIADFETAELPDETYDLVYAATAIHWIARYARFKKPHRILKPNGCLALIHTAEVSDGRGDLFVQATQPIYREFTEQPTTSDYVPPALAALVPMAIDESLFQVLSFDVFPVALEYTAETYVNLLRTFSPTIAMNPGPREAFLSRISETIDREFQGRIVRHVAMTLLNARKL